MLNVKVLLAKILTCLTNMIVVEEYNFGKPSYTAGTPGTVAATLSKDITKAGYTPIACSTRFVAASVVSFCPYLNQGRNTLYIQVLRTVSSAQTFAYDVYGIVVYLKN